MESFTSSSDTRMSRSRIFWSISFLSTSRFRAALFNPIFSAAGSFSCSFCIWRYSLSTSTVVIGSSFTMAAMPSICWAAGEVPGCSASRAKRVMPVMIFAMDFSRSV